MNCLIHLENSNSKEYFIISSNSIDKAIKVVMESKNMLTVYKLTCTMVSDKDYLELLDYI